MTLDGRFQQQLSCLQKFIESDVTAERVRESAKKLLKEHANDKEKIKLINELVEQYLSKESNKKVGERFNQQLRSLQGLIARKVAKKTIQKLIDKLKKEYKEDSVRLAKIDKLVNGASDSKKTVVAESSKKAESDVTSKQVEKIEPEKDKQAERLRQQLLALHLRVKNGVSDNDLEKSTLKLFQEYWGAFDKINLIRAFFVEHKCSIRFIRQFFSFVDLIEGKSAPKTLEKSLRKLFKEHYAVSEKKELLLKIFAYLKISVPEVASDQAPQPKVVSTRTDNIVESFTKRLNDLRNSALQGHTAAVEKGRLRMLADFPDRKDEIEKVAQTISCSNIVVSPQTHCVQQNVASEVAQDCLSKKSVSSSTEQLKDVVCEETSEIVLPLFDEQNWNPQFRTKSPTTSQALKDEEYLGKRYCARKPLSFGVSGFNAVKRLEVAGAHPNYLGARHFSSSWTVLIDETGDFKANLSSSSARIVAIFVPENVRLMPCKIHACEEQSFNKIEKTVRELLDSRCGIFGLSVDSLGFTSDYPWLSTLNTLLKLAVLLLPYEIGKDVSLNVMVERRLNYCSVQDLRVMSANVKDGLTKLFPVFASHLKLDVKIVDKDYEWIGYPDVVANLWGGERFQRLFEYTQWSGSCLIDGQKTNQVLSDAYEILDRRLDPDDWEKLISSPEYGRPSIVDAVLRKFGEQLIGRTNRDWEPFFEHAKNRSVNISPELLFKELQWLRSYMPASATFADISNFEEFCRRTLSDKLYLRFYR